VLRWLDRAWLWRILLEGQVGSRPVVVAEVAAQTTTEVSLVEDNHVVEQFTSDGADHALDKRVSARASVAQ
jgi:GH25 family lysozyme M1 (1,4-beta-N-acetylmuramidase)